MKQLIFILCLFSSLVSAHPHSYITMNLALFNDQDVNSIHAIEFSWTMDTISSASILVDLKSKNQKVRDELTRDIRNNVAKNNFFSYIKSHNKTVSFNSETVDFKVGLVKQDMVMTFKVELENPVPVDGFNISTYEKTYFTSMQYSKVQDITFTNPSHCSIILQNPQVGDFLRNYAMDLDKDDTDDDTLGANFAQQVYIQCTK